jgi:hypothetical protein
MSVRTLAIYSIGALAGASMLALSSGSASAFTLAGPSLDRSVASAQIDKAWWRGGWRGGWGWRGYGWRGYGWGYPYYGYGWRGYGWGYPGYWGYRCWRCY